MKNTENDILMICKGYYNQEKHKTLEDALDAYYRKYYCIPKEKLPVLSYRFMLHLWFNRCVEVFLTPDRIRSFWQNVIVDEAFQEKRWLNEDGCTEFYEVLYHRIVTWLILLNVKDDKGNWVIDVSDYTEDVI